MKLQQFQHFIIKHLYRCFNFNSVFLSPLYFVFSDPFQGCLLRHKTKKRKRTRKVMKLTRRWRRRRGKRRWWLIPRLLRPPPSSILFSVFSTTCFFLSLSVYILACFLFAFLMLARVLLLVHAIKIKMKWNESSISGHPKENIKLSFTFKWDIFVITDDMTDQVQSMMSDLKYTTDGMM